MFQFNFIQRRCPSDSKEIAKVKNGPERAIIVVSVSAMEVLGDNFPIPKELKHALCMRNGGGQNTGKGVIMVVLPIVWRLRPFLFAIFQRYR